MKKLFRMILCCLSLAGVLITCLGTTVPVRADDGGPASPETPVATDEPVVTEVPTQEPVVPDVSIVTEVLTQESVVPDVSIVTEVPTQESVIPEFPIASNVSTEEPIVQEETPVEGLLASVPEGTDVLVLDESGLPEPLVTQAAIDTLLTGDPLWCPANIAPVANTGGCTASYTSFKSLLLYLSAHEPGQAGVIWIAKDYDSGVNDAASTSFTLDGNTNFPTMKNFALTIQGGWNGDSAATINDTDPSEFNATLSIVNWNGDVSLNNLLFTETNGQGMNVTPWGPRPSPQGAGLAVTTTGNVKLSRVDASRNSSNGVLIDNRSGLGTVSINRGNFSGNGTSVFGGLGIYVLSKGTITISNVTANDNSWEGAEFFNDTLASSQGDVNLLGSNTFNNNNRDGLMISSRGNISLNSVTVNGNGLTGAYIYNADGTGDVTFRGTNTFNDNVGTGMYVYSDGVITIHNVTATGNGMEGAVLLNGLHHPSNKVVFTGTDEFLDNGGLYPDLYSDLYIALDDNFVQYRDVTTHGKITLEPLDELPGSLPDDVTFVSALQVLPIGNKIVISFTIPSSMQDAEFYILYWDGSQWVNLETAVFEDGRRVMDSGHKTENGYFQATVNFGGIFVLVQK